MSTRKARTVAGDVRRAGPSRFTIVVISICLLAPALFSSILPGNLRNLLLLFGCVFSTACLFIYHQDFDLMSLGVGFAWLLFAIAAMLSRIISGDTFSYAQIALPLSAYVACVASCGTRWIKPVMYCVIAMLSVHLAATFLFLVFPPLYSGTVKQWFFSDLDHATGYQCGLSSHYSDNAFLMATGTILAAAQVFGSDGKDRKRFVFLMILFGIGLLLTQKRSHLLFTSFAVLCLYVGTGARGRALKLASASIVAILAAIVASTFIPGISESFDRLLGTFTALESGNLEEATSGRTLLWGAAIDGWLEHPLLGNGWGSYVFIWPGGNQSIYAHNELLQILHDTGIVGFSAFILLILSSLVISYRNIKEVRYRKVHGTALVASYFSFSFNVFMITYSFTTGVLLQEPLIFICWFFSNAIALAIRYEIVWRGR